MDEKPRRQKRADGRESAYLRYGQEAEETLDAIRQYLVDAFVITRPDGSKVVTLSDADYPYRVMVESMNEGAATIIKDGTLFYCNPRFAQMLEAEPSALIGSKLQDYIQEKHKQRFQAWMDNPSEGNGRQQFEFETSQGTCIPVQLSMYNLGEAKLGAVALIATDVTQRVDAERKIRILLSELTMAEQDERQRISEILHDDLQQRLFAIKAQLSFVEEPLQKEGESRTEAELKLIQDWLTDAINITRNLSIDLSPMILQGEGLAEALVWLKAQMKRRYGLEVEVLTQNDMHFMDTSLRMLIFQAVRELLFNVVKHAESLQATVTLRKGEAGGKVTITDQGKGFNPEEVLNDHALAHGLLLLKDRLALIGCGMEIRSAPDKGTRVEINIPEGVTKVTP